MVNIDSSRVVHPSLPLQHPQLRKTRPYLRGILSSARPPHSCHLERSRTAPYPHSCHPERSRTAPYPHSCHPERSRTAPSSCAVEGPALHLPLLLPSHPSPHQRGVIPSEVLFNGTEGPAFALALAFAFALKPGPTNKPIPAASTAGTKTTTSLIH